MIGAPSVELSAKISAFHDAVAAASVVGLRSLMLDRRGLLPRRHGPRRLLRTSMSARCARRRSGHYIPHRARRGAPCRWTRVPPAGPSFAVAQSVGPSGMATGASIAASVTGSASSGAASTGVSGTSGCDEASVEASVAFAAPRSQSPPGSTTVPGKR